MTKAVDAAKLDTLVKRLEALPIDALDSASSGVEHLLLDLAVAFRDATEGSAWGVANSRELGARACHRILSRQPSGKLRGSARLDG